MDNPWEVARRITAAGSVFIGNYTPESAGRLCLGDEPHTADVRLGTFVQRRNLDSFMRKITFQEISPAGLQRIGGVIETMAAAEGLGAHKNAVTLRLRKQE